MASPQEILVATFARPNFLLVERATRNQGLAVAQVDPTLEAISACISSNAPMVVVVDALQQEEKALEFCKHLNTTYAQSRILVLGARADIASVAKAIVAGARNYFLPHTPVEELFALLADAVANKAPSDDSLFGRVRSALPSPPDKEGICRTLSGRGYAVPQAIEQCMTLGLTENETAGYLGVPVSEATSRPDKPARSADNRLSPPIGASVLTRLAMGAVVVGLLLFAIRAFSRPSLPFEVAPLIGTVTLNGTPLVGCVVKLTPDGSRNTKGATGIGVTDARGRYSITTLGHDGAIVGYHRVSVVPADTQEQLLIGAEGPRIPDRYWHESTSGLECQVSTGGANTLDIPMASASVPQTR